MPLKLVFFEAPKILNRFDHPFETQVLQSVILFSELISITVTVTVIRHPGINYKTVMW